MPSVEPVADRSRRALWTWLILAAAAAIAVSVEIAAQALVVGSRDGQWVYGYVAPLSAPAVAAALGAIAACCALLAASDVTGRRSATAQIVMWIAAAFAVQILLRTLAPFSFQQIFASDGANSFYGVTRHYFASTVLRDFDRLRATFPIHAQSNMPGKLMLVYALRSVSRRPDVLAWLVVAVSNLGSPLMYLFVRDLFDDEATALCAAILYLFVPGKFFFFPLLNTATPVLVLALACLFARWLKTRRTAYAIAIGIGIYAIVFFEPLALAIGLLFSVLLADAVRSRRVRLGSLPWHGAAVLAGFAATYVVVYLTAGFDLAGAFRQVSAAAIAFNADERPYRIWLLANLREFLVATGACQAVLVGAALLGGRRARDGAHGSTRTMAVVCAGLIAVLSALDLAGVNRGEVTRLWIFLACFFQIPAAYVCARLESRAALAAVLAVTLLESALGASMIGFVSP